MIAPAPRPGRVPHRGNRVGSYLYNSDTRNAVNSDPCLSCMSTTLFNAAMKTIEEIRRDWLLLLIDRFGSLARLNEALGRARTDATLSQIKNQARDSKSGNPKNMGSPLAREIEHQLGLDRGTLDHPVPTSTPATQELVRTITTLTESGKLSPDEIRAMNDMLKARR